MCSTHIAHCSVRNASTCWSDLAKGLPLATSVKLFAAPRYNLLVWSRDGLVRFDRDHSVLLQRDKRRSLSLAARCLRGKPAFFDAVIHLRGDTASTSTPRVNARQVGMPV